MNLNLDELKNAYDAYDSLREKIIIQSRVVLKCAKKLIYSIHRDNSSEAKKNLDLTKKEFMKLSKIAEKSPRGIFEGSYLDAAEEFVEGVLYFDFVNSKKLSSIKELNVSSETYLGALADLSGELVRRAVNQTIKQNYDEIYRISDFVNELYKTLLGFNFRSGQLRKKSDSVRWNLNKIEDILYNIELKNK